ncbi:DNA internalization-related competence protein ComEC/Rec2 [Fodinibius roseus]|uniref:DNA internalization-related competence protein ComEC/Rec2 n=1 Tax=Fodinibius roseus TaxID=1194090 RepID=UPI00093549BD|nr:DNA internalization-related competence protein ComEC/Rec2 [Fodinibius roseus]
MTIHQTYQFPFASYPAVRLALLFAAGIIMDFHIDGEPFWWFGLFGFSSLFYALCEERHRQTLKTRLYHGTVGFYLCAVVCFGGAWHAAFNVQDMPPEAEILYSYTWQELSFRGEVYRIQPTRTGNYHIDVAVDTTVFPKKLPWVKSYNLRTTLNPDEIPFPADLRLGDRLHVTARVYPLEEPGNPHEFDYKRYLASNEIYLQAGIMSIDAIHTPNHFFSWNSFRRDVLDAIDHNFSPPSASLAKALLIGYKSELRQETEVAFSRAGLSHIMAVSGLHVGFILAPFWLAIPLFWTFRHGKKIGLLMLAALLFFYAGLTGFSASVTRASLTGGLLMYGRLFHKVRNSKNLTAVAALLILVMNPSDLFTVGFQLSFGAVYIILLAAPVITQILPDRLRFRWYGTPLMVVVISLIVQVGLFPLLGYYFGEFSIIGPLANAFVVPFLGIVVPLSLALLPVALGWAGVARALNTPADYFLSHLNRFVTVIAGWEWSWMPVHIESALLFVSWTSALFFIASVRIPRLRWKWLSIVLFLLCINQGQKLCTKLQPADLQLMVFDVGQGDATLIRTPGGKHYLIDTGLWQPGYNSARYILIPYLRAEGIRRLEGVFLSHPHADHIGGVTELINNIPIDTIYHSGSPYESDLFNNYRAAAADNNIPVKPLEAGQWLMPDAATRLFVYGPQNHLTASSPSDVNNRSLVLELVYGGTEFLFMGDAERAQEQRLLESYPRFLETDVLKVAHHGSRSSSTDRFLRASRPAVGILSLDLHNRFGHPHVAAVRRLRNHIESVYFTSLDGAIRLTSDGHRIRVGR